MCCCFTNVYFGGSYSGLPRPRAQFVTWVGAKEGPGHSGRQQLPQTITLTKTEAQMKAEIDAAKVVAEQEARARADLAMIAQVVKTTVEEEAKAVVDMETRLQVLEVGL